MKQILKRMLHSLGYELKKVSTTVPGSDRRGIGHMGSFLEDIRKRGLEVTNAIDCGANEGWWAGEFLKVYDRSNLLMIEPQAEMEPKLLKVVQRYPNAKFFIGAVGERNEKGLFTIWPDKKGSSFFPEEDAKALAAGNQIHLDLKTLPTIVKESGFGPPTLIKMDIQGMELNVLKGMDSMIGSVELFILECNLFPFFPALPQADGIIAWLAGKGFRIYDVCGSGRRPSDGALSHIDFVFANDAGFLRKYKGW